jgi:hypothetical protein
MARSLTRDPSALGGRAEPPPSAGKGRPGAAATTDALAGWSGAHPVNIRITLPTPWGRIFLLLLAGSERRGPVRRRVERARHPLATFGNLLVMLLLGGLVGLAGLAAIQLATALLLGEVEIPPS